MRPQLGRRNSSHVPTSIGRLGLTVFDWPDGDVPQQAHIDIDVLNLDGAEIAVQRLGVEKAATQPAPEHFRVMIDPAGHPFCLVLAPDLATADG